MYNPVSTYRLQFSKDFTISDLTSIIDYLNQLKIKTIYASPILQAVSGSEHGYDVVNPLRINAALGSEKQLNKLNTLLHKNKMGWLQDIVPNHMAYSTENPWIQDLLEKGENSIYADYFDVDWENKSYHQLTGKLSLPFFGDEIDFLVKNREVSVSFMEDSGLALSYYDNHYPLNIESYKLIINKIRKTSSEIEKSLEDTLNVTDRPAFYQRFDHLKHALQAMYKKSKGFRSELDAVLDTINSDDQTMSDIIHHQHYLPEYWEHTNRRINYRRFFTINDMICLSMEKQAVFEHYHKYIFKLIDDGLINGLRIDHVDGLFFPGEYLDRLRKATGEDHYIIVEKILEKDEEIPTYWPVQGTTGYHYLALCNNLLTNNDAAPVFNNLHEEIGGKRNTDYESFAYRKKKFILYERMLGELNNLTSLCVDLRIMDILLDREQLKEAIAEILIQCPVYKLYFEKDGISENEKETLHAVFEAAQNNRPELSKLLERLYNSIIRVNEASGEKRNNIMHFLRRMMQFTGPLTAKGVEDTSFYTYNLYIAHNEVGDSPDYYGICNEEFHEAMLHRQELFPLALNATSTHDTKRGEDFRARLNVLSDVAPEWKKYVLEWRKLNEQHKTQAKELTCPSPNDEYFIYQSLIGGFPVDIMEIATFTSRFKDYIIKSIREGKENSSWIKPNKAYEKGILQFIDNIINTESDFFQSFIQFYRKVKSYGYLNSLAQVVLKSMCPGVPDFYQGCELWNFSMVDPDNRRKVDYKYRSKVLHGLMRKKNYEGILEELWSDNDNGNIKLYVTYRLLQEREQMPELFTYGDYHPLVAEGKNRNHLFGFIRKYKSQAYMVMLPMHLASAGFENILNIDWKDTCLTSKESISGTWKNIFDNKLVEINDKYMAGEIFLPFPLAVLKLE